MKEVTVFIQSFSSSVLEKVAKKMLNKVVEVFEFPNVRNMLRYIEKATDLRDITCDVIQRPTLYLTSTLT